MTINLIGFTYWHDTADFGSLPTNIAEGYLAQDRQSGVLYWFKAADSTWVPVGSSAVIDLSQLKSYWKFNELSGNILNQAGTVGSVDSLGSAADITPTNFTYGLPGIIDTACSLDGSTSFGDVGTSNSQYNFLHQQQQSTIIIWYRFPSVPTTDVCILDTTNIATGSGIFMQFLFSSGQSKLRYQLQDGTTGLLDFRTSDGFVPSDTAWHMIAVQVDHSLATNAVTMSIDDGTKAQAGTTTNVTGNAADAMNIGQFGNGSQRINALFDEWSIWNRRATDQEITNIHNNGAGLEL